jgi:hypothetical protein
MRTETKYLLSCWKQARVEQDLLQVGFSRDKFSQSILGYNVNSLYFDDRKLTTFYAKTDGISRRFKVRLRYYSEEAKTFNLEIKHKDGNAGWKSRFSFTRKEIFDFFDSRTNKFSDFIEVNYPAFSPSLFVCYKRVAMYGNIAGDPRISFDSDVSWSAPPQNSKQLATLENNNLLPPQQIVLEIKSSERLPRKVIKIIQKNNLKWVENSKYANCIIAAKGFDFL